MDLPVSIQIYGRGNNKALRKHNLAMYYLSIRVGTKELMYTQYMDHVDIIEVSVPTADFGLEHTIRLLSGTRIGYEEFKTYLERWFCNRDKAHRSSYRFVKDFIKMIVHDSAKRDRALDKLKPYNRIHRLKLIGNLLHAGHTRKSRFLSIMSVITVFPVLYANICLAYHRFLFEVPLQDWMTDVDKVAIYDGTNFRPRASLV